MQAEAARLEQLRQGRNLVLFMPTFRNAQEDAYYRFAEEEIAWLRDWLERNNAVLGVREHMADSARTYGTMLAPLGAIDLSDDEFPNVEVLYRQSSVLITDYSSCFIDHMLTGKPAISFAYDYENYANVERGAFYDLEFVFPGPVCRTFAELSAALDAVLQPRSPVDEALYDWKRRLFFDHVDDRNSERLAAKVRKLANFDDIGGRLHAIGI
jgi:CDP-glycerol glycerophosphotransferase (TagB/SpsB family)